MSMSEIESNKRRRTSPGSITIDAMPDALLGGVAEFLPKPSRAIFAVAMTAPSSSWAKCYCQRQPSATIKAILSSTSHTSNVPKVGEEKNTERWATLDFFDIDKSLASRLTDDDVGAILVCINANKSLKKLKLTGCVNITGHGLEPLRGSVVLEQIDLSLAAQHESPAIEPDPSISEAAALPILDSIVGTDRSSLKYIQLPHAWRKNQSSLLDEFLARYNVLLGNSGSSCSECDTLLSDNTVDDCLGWIGCDRDHKRKPLYGLQNYTCYSCLKCFCYDCENEHGPLLNCCYVCKKDYCHSCVPGTFCSICGEDFCHECSKLIECQCGDVYCRKCFDVKKCTKCGTTTEYCKSCAKNNYINNYIVFCGDCGMEIET